MNAPAIAPSLITCEHGYGRLLERACAKRYLIAMGRAPADAATVSNLTNSKCKGCSAGATRAAAGAHKGPVQLVQSDDRGQEPGALHKLSQKRNGALLDEARPFIKPAQLPIPMRKCAKEDCAIEFGPVSRNQLFCCPEHSRWATEQQRKRRATIRPPAAEPEAAPEIKPAPVAKAPKPPHQLTCSVCGKAFLRPRTGGRLPKTCGPCWHEGELRRVKEARRKAKEEELMPKFEAKDCVKCGKPFKPHGPNERYCKNPCTSYRGGPVAKGKLVATPTVAVAKGEPENPSAYRVHIGTLAIDCATIESLEAVVERFGGA